MSLALICCFAMFASGTPQKLTFQVASQPIAKTLEQLSGELGLPLLYEPIPANLVAAVDCQNCAPETLLQQLFSQTLAHWKRVGDHYVVQLDPKGRGILQGSLLLRDTAEPIGGAWVFLARVGQDQDEPLRVATDGSGQFVTPPLIPGDYQLWMEVPGFEMVPLEQVTLAAYEKKPHRFEADMIALPPGEMVITPGHYELLAEKPTMTHYRTKQDLERMPHLGNDILRALAALPGANRDGISARPRSHGGLEGEVQIQLDGMILRDPFHAKELGGAVSAINGQTLDGLQWQAGGFTADYGNALGGLMSFESQTPGQEGTMVGLSLTDNQVLQKGGFASGRGHYLVSARAGNLGLLLDMINFQADEPTDGDQFSSSYFDSFAKLHYVVSEKHAVAGHLHSSFDEVDYGPSFSRGEGLYQDHAFWVNVDSFWNERWESQTHISWSHYTDKRVGFNQNLFGTLDYADDRRVRTSRLGQRWRFQQNHFDLRAGWFVEAQAADYDYHHRLMVGDIPLFGLSPETETRGTFEGHAYEGFFAARMRLHADVIAEIGGRFDYQTWIKQNQWSPRFNLAWQLTPQAQVKLAAGRFYQPRQLHQLQAEDGRAAFEDPAMAEHYLLGMHYLWQSGLTTRLELFYKPTLNPAIRFENLWSQNFLFDQLELDRIRLHPDRSAVHGAELSLGWDGNGRISWLGNYTWSQSWDEFDDEKFYRRYDQRHALNLNLSYRLSHLWHGHLAWNYVSGWRTTKVEIQRNNDELELVLGPLNGEPLPPQHRLDLRFNRKARGNKGFAWHIDIINLYNRKNVRGYDDIYLNGDEELVLEESTGLPLLITFGVTWNRLR